MKLPLSIFNDAVRDANGDIVAMMYTNGEQMVSAINAHAGLVAALEEISRTFGLAPGIQAYVHCRSAAEIARAALAAADVPQADKSAGWAGVGTQG